MGYKLKVLLSAEIDIAKALEYYSEINDVLPGKFLDQVESTYKYLRFNPYFQKRHKNFRGIPVTNFPYLILFTIDENKKLVKIISCFQTSQDPKKYPR